MNWRSNPVEVNPRREKVRARMARRAEWLKEQEEKEAKAAEEEQEKEGK